MLNIRVLRSGPLRGSDTAEVLADITEGEEVP